MLIPIQATYYDRKEELKNKVGGIDMVGSDNTKMVDKVVYKSVHNITSRSRSGIQLTQSRFKLMRFNDGRRD